MSIQHVNAISKRLSLSTLDRKFGDVFSRGHFL